MSYSGEETGVCHKLSLEQVLPALPPKEHGASVDVLSFVNGTTWCFLEDPERMVLEDVGQELPGLQGRIHIEKGDESHCRRIGEAGFLYHGLISVMWQFLGHRRY